MMAKIKPIVLWSFYGLYFSKKIRKIVEQGLKKLEEEEKEKGNWLFTSGNLSNKDNKLVFTFTFKDGGTRQLEFDIGEKIFCFPTILMHSSVEYYGFTPNIICLGAYFLKSEKKPLQKMVTELEKQLRLF